MIDKILNIRLKQAYRIINELGIFRVIFLLGLAVTLLAGLFLSMKEKVNSNKELIIGLFALSILIIHLKRKDKDFLEIYAPKPQGVFIVEYIVLSVPLILSLLYKRLWSFIFIYLLILILISFLKIIPKKSSLNTIF